MRRDFIATGKNCAAVLVQDIHGKLVRLAGHMVCGLDACREIPDTRWYASTGAYLIPSLRRTVAPVPWFPRFAFAMLVADVVS